MYELIKPVGGNDHTTVYEARDRSTGQRVALKIVESDTAKAEWRQRLKREAYAMAACHHPLVLECFGLYEHDGKPSLAMEFCECGDLGNKLHAALPPRETAQIVEMVAQAVEAVHTQGLVHASIATRHIFIEKGGQVKLGGFGKARMAGDNQRADIKADLFDLGLVFYEMLVAPRPSDGERASKRCLAGIDTNHRIALPMPGTAPPELQSACLACLGQTASVTFESAGDLVLHLRQFIQTTEKV